MTFEEIRSDKIGTQNAIFGSTALFSWTRSGLLWYYSVNIGYLDHIPEADTVVVVVEVVVVVADLSLSNVILVDEKFILFHQ